jgi:hypothetical protein
MWSMRFTAAQESGCAYNVSFLRIMAQLLGRLDWLFLDGQEFWLTYGAHGSARGFVLQAAKSDLAPHGRHCNPMLPMIRRLARGLGTR